MTKSALAFESLNLRFNPFGELSGDQWLAASIVDIEHLVAPLRLPNVAVQFLADHGRGKTTHLRKLHQEFSDAPYIKLYIDEKLPVFPKSRLTFIDSFENANKSRRKKIYKKTNSLAFTTHSDLTDELEKRGYKVVTERVSCNSNEKLLNILNTRIEIARNGSGDLPLLNMEKVTQLRENFGDDIRAMQYQLYEEYQLLKEKENVEMRCTN